MLEPAAFGDPMTLVAEAQAADPDAEALHALLDALRGRFGGAEFTAKQVLDAIRAGMGETDLETAIKDIAGDNGVRSVRSLGRVLKFREGRIVHGLRMTSRPDSHAGALFYRVTG